MILGAGHEVINAIRTNVCTYVHIEVEAHQHILVAT